MTPIQEAHLSGLRQALRELEKLRKLSFENLLDLDLIPDNLKNRLEYIITQQIKRGKSNE